MAKARSNMGQKSVGAMQYDEREMVASVQVYVQDEDESSVTFDLVKKSLQEKSEGVETSVRKRVATTIDESEVDNVGTSSSDQEKKEKIAKNDIRDPLLMFGVLVPQALRLSKSCFQRSLPVVSKICSTQAEIMRLKAEYQALHTQVAE